jgi:PncC family amidohydrolase
MRRVFLVGNLRYRWGIVEELVRWNEWDEIKFVDSVDEIKGEGVAIVEKIPDFCPEGIEFYTPNQLEQIEIRTSIPIYIFGRKEVDFLDPILGNYRVSKGEGNFWEVRVPSLSKSDAQKLLRREKRIVIGDLFKFLVQKMPPKKVGIAESCTGGRVSAYITRVAGASALFDGGMVTYSNLIKQKWLGVREWSLEKYGAVSAEVVTQMVEGIIEKSRANYGIAISGIAGPTGGTPQKPVGTVYIGVGDRYQIWVEKYQFSGTRGYIQHQSALTAVGMLIQFAQLYGILDNLLPDDEFEGF